MYFQFLYVGCKVFFIYSTNNLLTDIYGSETSLGARDTIVNNTKLPFHLYGVCILVRDTDSKQMDMQYSVMWKSEKLQSQVRD